MMTLGSEKVEKSGLTITLTNSYLTLKEFILALIKSPLTLYMLFLPRHSDDCESQIYFNFLSDIEQWPNYILVFISNQKISQDSNLIQTGLSSGSSSSSSFRFAFSRLS